MVFNINQIEYSNEKQRNAAYVGARMIPLEVSLADVPDPETREGCMQIYAWITETVTDVYNNPDHYQTANILDILSHETSLTTGAQRYPLLEKYWPIFCAAAEKRRVNVSEYIVQCDFRVFAPRYKRSIDDLLRIVPDRSKVYVKQMHEYALAKGAKLEPHKYYAYFRYKYKNETLLELRRNTWRHTPLDIAASYGGIIEFDGFMRLIAAEPDRDVLLNYLQKELSACDACGGKKKASNRCVHATWKEISGKRRLLAACKTGVNKWKAPKSNLEYHDNDIIMLTRMLDVRVKQIDTTKP